jgi:hypothetical protein
MLIVALLLLSASDCRELHEGHPKFSPNGDTGYENYRVAIVECAGERALIYAKRESANADWLEVHRVPVKAPASNFTWFFDGASCAPKGEKSPSYLNRAVMAHASAVNGQLETYQPVEAWHVDMKKNAWVRDDAKKIICHADEP